MNRFQKFYIAIIVLLSGIACKPEIDAQFVIDKAIQFHGGSEYDNLKINFDFRNRHYEATRNNGIYLYKRSFSDSSERVVDYLSNESFKREINRKKIELTDKKSNSYRNSVNSVIYFALLPYGLNDGSVKKELIGEININGVNYHKIRVSFEAEGGGDDYQDIFVYWFDKEDYSMDYLAYKYFDNKGGIRFREAKNTREVNGLIFSDYNNYALEGTEYPIENIDELFLAEDLDLLSSIELKNIIVE